MNYEDYTKEELISLVQELSGDLDIANREVEDLEYEGCSTDDTIRTLENTVEELEYKIEDLVPETVLDEMKWEILMDLKELHIEKLEDIRDVYINHKVSVNIDSIINKAMDDAFAKEWVRIASQNRSFLPIDPVAEKRVVSIKLEDWDYSCGEPGCCYEYGVQLTVNGELCDNSRAGDDVESALKFTLNKLGYDVNLEWKYNDED